MLETGSKWNPEAWMQPRESADGGVSVRTGGRDGRMMIMMSFVSFGCRKGSE